MRTEIRIEERIQDFFVLFFFCFSFIFRMPEKLIFIQPFNILVITENWLIRIHWIFIMIMMIITRKFIFIFKTKITISVDWSLSTTYWATANTFCLHFYYLACRHQHWILLFWEKFFMFKYGHRCCCCRCCSNRWNNHVTNDKTNN